jgi:hypothetical protein
LVPWSGTFHFVAERLARALPKISHASRLSQEEVFEDKVAVAGEKWFATGKALHLLRRRFWPGLDLYQVIKCLAVRAREGIE